MLKIIKITKNKQMKYLESIASVRAQGPIVTKSRPYIGMLDTETDKIVSVIWIDDENEISIITDEAYRKKGLMTKMISRIIDEVFKKKLERIEGTPFNKNSLSILKKAGFIKNPNGGYIFELE